MNINFDKIKLLVCIFIISLFLILLNINSIFADEGVNSVQLQNQDKTIYTNLFILDDVILNTDTGIIGFYYADSEHNFVQSDNKLFVLEYSDYTTNKASVIEYDDYATQKVTYLSETSNILLIEIKYYSYFYYKEIKKLRMEYSIIYVEGK